jgi:MFS family permease
VFYVQEQPVMEDVSPTRSENDSPRGWLNRTVLGAGLTSAFGDFAYETTNVLLPGFLSVLGLPAAVLGTVEGIADATASFTKLGAGYISDRLGSRKPLVVFGYALTPVGQILIALAWGWPLILCGRVLSWFGKGIRGPLRDAIVAESITPATRGRAFGFHRAMDTVGAVVGPLLGIALLAWAQRWGWSDPSRAFRVVFWCTLIPGVLSVLSFAILVRDDGERANKSLRFLASLRQLPKNFRRYLGVVAVFGVGDFSHSLLILAATQLLTPRLGVLRAAQIAGVLYVVRNVVQTVASYPIGAAADRFGHVRVLVCGYALGAATAGLAALAFMNGWNNWLSLALIFVIAGLYVAVQEALEPSLTADFIPGEFRGVAYGALGAVNGSGKLASSVTVGALWTAVSPQAAFGLAALLMTAGTLLLPGIRPKTSSSPLQT